MYGLKVGLINPNLTNEDNEVEKHRILTCIHTTCR